MLVVRVGFNVVVLGEPGKIGVAEIIVPWGPGGSPEVHHNLGGLGQEVHVWGVLGLADEVVVDVPGHVVWGPLEGVGVPFVLGVEASGVVVVLLAILPDDVH